MKDIYQWYKSLKGYKKIIASFLINWIYWGFINFFVFYVFPITAERNRSIREYFITVTIGAVLWTIIYSINYRKLFGKVNKDQNAEVSDTTKDQQRS